MTVHIYGAKSFFFSAAGTGKAKKNGSAAPVSLAEGDGGEAKKGAEFGAVSAFAMGRGFGGKHLKLPAVV